MAKCALCLQDRKLCKSHILPELFYKHVYDENPKRFFTVSTDSAKKPQIRQKGIWERLLCEDCEQKLSDWESHAARMLYQEAIVREMPGRLEVVGLDYEKFKLFQLSVLWRAGASTRSEFRDLTLGPHEERIRRMLMNNNPGSPDRYGCFLTLCPPYKNQLQRMILAPYVVKAQGYHMALFLMGGLFWHYFTASHKLPFDLEENIFLSKDGVLPILFESEVTSRYIEGVYRRWKESGNIDYVLNRED